MTVTYPDADILVDIVQVDAGGLEYFVYTLGMSENPPIGESTYNKLGDSEVTGVTLNKTSTTLNIGSRETLTATVSPSTASDKTVVWSSSDKTKATVDSTGNTSNISVSTTNGNAVVSNISYSTAEERGLGTNLFYPQ